ncbi:MAG: hypothetical protein ACE5H8_02125 [Alphaproteobacteria bacterium]
MTTRDLTGNIDVQTSLDPGAYTATTNGTGVDLRGFESAAVAFVVGAVTDGAHTPAVEDSDDGATWGPATLSGALADLASNTNQRVGYRGGKRYLRAKLTVSGATIGAQAAAVVIRGNAARRPVA